MREELKAAGDHLEFRYGSSKMDGGVAIRMGAGGRKMVGVE
jgi:hypothetical protein